MRKASLFFSSPYDHPMLAFKVSFPHPDVLGASAVRGWKSRDAPQKQAELLPCITDVRNHFWDFCVFVLWVSSQHLLLPAAGGQVLCCTLHLARRDVGFNFDSTRGSQSPLLQDLLPTYGTRRRFSFIPELSC